MRAFAHPRRAEAPAASAFGVEVRRGFTRDAATSGAVRRYHKALLIVLACSLAMAAGLLRAYVNEPRELTSAEVLAATRRSVDQAVDAAIRSGGLLDAESYVARAIAEDIRRQGFSPVDVVVRRPNDLNPWAAFHFLVDVRAFAVRFDIEGTRDPLLALRLGQDVTIRADPLHPYASHGDPNVLTVCLAHRYYHAASDAPDLFARLENRTRDPYHFGFETFLTDGDRLAVDHAFLETGTWGLDDEHRARYGL